MAFSSPLHSQAAEWTLILAIDAPRPPEDLLQEFNIIQNPVDNTKLSQVVDNNTKILWKQQIMRLRAQVSLFEATGHRHKHGILGFLAPLFSSCDRPINPRQCPTMQRSCRRKPAKWTEDHAQSH